MRRARAIPSTTESLTRWFAAWVAAVVCLHALSAGTAALWFNAHRHGSAPETVTTTPMVLWRHAADRTPHDLAAAHARAHMAGESHHHTADDMSVLPSGSDASAAALAAFVAGPVARAFEAAAYARLGLHHVWAMATPWAPTARTVSPPRHPPRM
jgi:hypothetical protein